MGNLEKNGFFIITIIISEMIEFASKIYKILY